MSDTGGINAINIAFYAEGAAARDQAEGTFDANLAADPYYYHWQGTEQLIPAGMNGDPEGFAAALRTALPGVNTLRLAFNAWSFDANGALDPLYERFLQAAAEQGFQIILTNHDGEVQQLGRDGDLTPAEIQEQLAGSVQERMLASWTQMMDWLDAHPVVGDAVYGYELANEPAAYERAVVLSPQGTKGPMEQQMMELYARHMAELADLVGTRDDGRILVGGWGFSGRFAEFIQNTVDGMTAADFLRAEIGDRLIWSAHSYPGWLGDTPTPEELAAALDAAFAPLGSDDILLTETNLSGALINDFSSETSVVQVFSRTQEWFAEHGIGIGWYPGAGGGASSFVTIDAGERLRYLHQHSFAFGMNAFSLDDRPVEHAAGEVIQATLVAARLRNEAYEADAQAGSLFDPVSFIGTAFGYDGNDTLIGGADANNFLYGGRGGDQLSGAAHEDFLFGQSGDDVLRGNGGRDLLFGGYGNDLLRGGAGDDTLEGGRGADRFDAGAGSDLITDLRPGLGDRLYLGRGYAGWSDVAGRISYAAVNGDAVDDVVIQHADGSTTTLLDARAGFGAGAMIFGGTAGVDGTSFADRIGPGYQDMGGQVFSTTLRRVDAGAGADTVTGSQGNDTVLGGNGNDSITGGGGRDRLSGGLGGDVLRGDLGYDTLLGGAGHDRLFGGAGNDRLDLGAGNDTALGGAGDDVILGRSGNNRISGDAGNDILYSGGDRSTLDGGIGADLLIADLHHSGHRLVGGAGADTFQFNGARSGITTRSVISDFDAAVDRIFLEGQRLRPENLPDGIGARATADGLLLVLEPGHNLLLDGFFL